MRKTMKSLALIGVVFGMVTVAVAAHALTRVERTTFLTFNRAVALPGIGLGAGTYLFELADPLSSQSVVRVSSADRRRIYLTAFTYAIQRPPDMRQGHVVTFGESGEGAPPPITAWFPDGSNTGRQFIYAK
jgi:hypothetical protein